MTMLKVKVNEAKMRSFADMWVGRGSMQISDCESVDDYLHVAAACLVFASNAINDGGETWHDETKFQSAVDAAEKLATIMIEMTGGDCEIEELEVTGIPRYGILRVDEWTKRRLKVTDPNNPPTL
jgi:hypothetical protein